MGYILVIILFIFLFLFLFFWFRKVQQIMEERRHDVEIAAEQLARFQKRKDLLFEVELVRSKDLYRQAVRQYQIAFENPFNRLPAILMGFRPITENDDSL